MENKKKIPKYTGPEISDNTRMMSKEEIQARFDAEIASIYSQRKPVWILEYDDVLQLLVKILQQYCKNAPLFIDLGAGTGNASLRVLENFPDCQITLVDFSENMLKEVDSVLAEYKGHYTIHIGDFHDITFKSNSYDGVYSSFALHHTRGVAAYKELYKEIYSWLKSGGIFICCDVVEGDSHIFKKIGEQGWMDFLRDQEFSEEDINRIFSNYRREDSPISIKQHINCLNEAGFQNIDILWKRHNFALYAAVK